MTIAGGACEIFGFGLVLVEIARVQRRVFPERRGWVKRILRRVRLMLGVAKPQTIQMSGTATAHASAGGAMTVKRPIPAGLDARVARLEQLVEDVRREALAGDEALDKRLVDVNARRNEEVQALRDALNEKEANEREELWDSLLFQRIGTGLFIFGVFFGVLGNVVSC